MSVSKLSSTPQSHASNASGDPSVKGRFSKFIHRHKTPLIVACTAIAMLTLGYIADVLKRKQLENTYKNLADETILSMTLANDQNKAPFGSLNHDQIDELIFARSEPFSFASFPKNLIDDQLYAHLVNSCKKIAEDTGIAESNIDFIETVISPSEDEPKKLSCYIHTRGCKPKEFLNLHSANTLQTNTQNIDFHDDTCSGWARVSVPKDVFSNYMQTTLPVHFAWLTTPQDPNRIFIKLAINM